MKLIPRQKPPLFQNDHVAVHHGDCLDVMARMPEASVDSIITDPPYGLEFMGKEWDSFKTYAGGNPNLKPQGKVAKHSKRGVSYGYRRKNPRCKRCGKLKRGNGCCKCPNPSWDTRQYESAFVFQSWCTVWARAALRVAKPGATLLAFGGTRTSHRLACAVEDAGWELRDCMMWVYGQGFPKSANIGKMIDKAAGAEREKIGKGTSGKTAGMQNLGPSGISGGDFDITAPATPAAKLWDGWGTALKPAWEPIIVAMKPLDGTFAANAVEHEVAGLWIDGGRIGTEQIEAHGGGQNDKRIYGQGKGIPAIERGANPHVGRWPANLILSHDPRCVRVGTTEAPGYVINRFPGGARPFGGGAGKAYESEAVPGGEREVWACVPGCPVRMLDGQSGERSSGSRRTGARKGMGYHGAGGDGGPAIAGSAGGASRFFYTAKATTAERVIGCPPGFKNSHPTVKPLSLCRYLCRLTKTPTGGVVLDPFSGSGSIAVAALLEGREAIAVELEEESARCTVGRVEAALRWGSKLPNLRKYKLSGRKNIVKRRKHR
jgi:site-specific DNA-methyltransferase (adenine-specific)